MIVLRQDMVMTLNSRPVKYNQSEIALNMFIIIYKERAITEYIILWYLKDFFLLIEQFIEK